MDCHRPSQRMAARRLRGVRPALASQAEPAPRPYATQRECAAHLLRQPALSLNDFVESVQPSRPKWCAAPEFLRERNLHILTRELTLRSAPELGTFSVAVIATSSGDKPSRLEASMLERLVALSPNWRERMQRAATRSERRGNGIAVSEHLLHMLAVFSDRVACNHAGNPADVLVCVCKPQRRTLSAWLTQQSAPIGRRTFLFLLRRLLCSGKHVHDHHAMHRAIDVDAFVEIDGPSTDADSLPHFVLSDWQHALDGAKEGFTDFFKMPYSVSALSKGGDETASVAPEVSLARSGPGAVVDYSASDIFSIGLVAHACASSHAGRLPRATGLDVFGTAEHAEYRDAVCRELDRTDPSHALVSARFGPAVNRLVARMLRVSPSARIGYNEALAEVERLIVSPMRVRVSDVGMGAVHTVSFGGPLLGDLRLRASIAMRTTQRSIAIYSQGALLSRVRDRETLTSLGIGPDSRISVELAQQDSVADGALPDESRIARKELVEKHARRLAAENIVLQDRIKNLTPPASPSHGGGGLSVSDAVGAFMAAQSIPGSTGGVLSSASATATATAGGGSSGGGSRAARRGSSGTAPLARVEDSRICDAIVALIRRTADTEGKIPFSTVFGGSGVTKPAWIQGSATVFCREREPYRSRLIISPNDKFGQCTVRVSGSSANLPAVGAGAAASATAARGAAAREIKDSRICDAIVAHIRRTADTEGKIPFSTVFGGSGVTKPAWIQGSATVFCREREPYRSRLIMSPNDKFGQCTVRVRSSANLPAVGAGAAASAAAAGTAAAAAGAARSDGVQKMDPATVLCSKIVAYLRVHGGTIRGSSLFGQNGVVKPPWFPGGLNYFTGRAPYNSQFIVSEKDECGQRMITLRGLARAAPGAASAPPASGSKSTRGGVNTYGGSKEEKFILSVTSFLASHGGSATMDEMFLRRSGLGLRRAACGTVELPAWVLKLPIGNRNGGLKKQCLSHPMFRHAFTVATHNKITKVVLNRAFRSVADDMADFRRDVIAYLTKYGPSKIDKVLAGKTLGVKMPWCVERLAKKSTKALAHHSFHDVWRVTPPASGTGPATVTLVPRVEEAEKTKLKVAIVSELQRKGGRIALDALFSGRALFQPAWLRIVAGAGPFVSDTAMVIAALSHASFADAFEIHGTRGGVGIAAPAVVLRAGGFAASGGRSSAGAGSASTVTGSVSRAGTGAARSAGTVGAVGTVGTIPQRARLVSKIVHAFPSARHGSKRGIKPSGTHSRRFDELWAANGLKLKLPKWLAAAGLSLSAL